MPPAGAEEAARETRSRIEAAVRSHLVADVPLGIFLSSGMDSTALAALASRESDAVRTFTLVFEEEGYSEGRLAGETARRLGTRHQESLLTGEEALSAHEKALFRSTCPAWTESTRILFPAPPGKPV